VRRDLCESAKRGKLCIDDLCHGVGETLCGFDPDLYAEMLDEDEPDYGSDELPTYNALRYWQ
jgi:hypothetical protein